MKRLKQVLSLGKKTVKGVILAGKSTGFILSKSAGVATGLATGTSELVSDSYYLFAGEKAINKQEQRIQDLYQKYLAKRRNVLSNYPYIDSAVISGISITQMSLQGVPKDIQLAYEGAYPDKAESVSFLEAWSSYDNHEARLGFVSGIKGKLFEIKYLDHLNKEMESGYVAALAESATQKGWDISITGPNQEIVNLIQMKATNSISYIKEALKTYPNIDIVTLSDLKNELLLADIGKNITASHVSSADLTNEIVNASSGGFNFLSLAIGVGFIVFSSYRMKDLSSFQKDKIIGERAVNLFTGWTILGASGVGIAAVPLVFLKDYLLRKGKIKKQQRNRLKQEYKALNFSIKQWDNKMSRRDFLKSLLLAPAVIKIATQKI